MVARAYCDRCYRYKLNVRLSCPAKQGKAQNTILWRLRMKGEKKIQPDAHTPILSLLDIGGIICHVKPLHELLISQLLKSAI